MATLEVTLKYRPPVARLVFWTITLLSPFWLLLPLILFLAPFLGLSTEWFYNNIFFGTVQGFNALLLCAPGIVLGASLWIVCREDKIVISQQGVCLPLSLSLLMFGRRNRPWYDLKSVSFNGAKNDNILTKNMNLKFSSGGTFSLRLKDLELTEVEQLMLAIETFASIKDEQPVLLAKQGLSEKLRIAGIKSYTNLWEDELRYRYSSTTFIPLAPGQKLLDGELKVIRQLGFGGLSAIYLVQRGGRDLHVLKESTVPADVDETMRQKAIEMFDREARLLSKLDHPQIAKVYDHFVESGRHYLLLQYIHGQDLRQFVKEHGAMEQSQVIDCAMQIAEILSYLHGSEPAIVHRDLTPENLVINDAGKIVLIDFGAANEFLQTATGTLVGKHSYIAPEQFRGKATTASDLYSLGGTIHFLLTGIDPIALSTSSPAKMNPQVAPALDRLVADLTRSSADKRGTAAETKTRLEQIKAGNDIAAKEVSL
jgi:serine/threonine protein kinase